MHRFFVSPNLTKQDKVIISGDQARQMHTVLRLKPGQRIIIFDDSELELEVEILDITVSQMTGAVLHSHPVSNEPKTKITLFQSLLKGSKFELVLQKGTEIGISKFVPMMSARCVAGEPSLHRIQRWRSIIIEAAEQSRRAVVPVLDPMARFEEAINSPGGLRILFSEHDGSTAFKTALQNVSPNNRCPELTMFIGPEGGFTDAESKFARQSGVAIVNLGQRTLRAETAGLVAAAAAMYEYDEFAGTMK